MKSFTAEEACSRLDEILDLVQQEPVQVLRHDRVAGVLVSAQDYEAMRRFLADRLQYRIDLVTRSAAAAGLTEERLLDLLSDES